MHGQRIGYVRVSNFEQNPERQLEHVHQVDRLFTDKASGKDMQRPELERLLAFVREADTVVVHSMDRLARNLDDLRRIVQKLTQRGVRIEFVKENLTFTGEDSPLANLMLSIMGAFAEFERALIRERQREGIAAARALAQRGTGCDLQPAAAPGVGRARGRGLGARAHLRQAAPAQAPRRRGEPHLHLHRARRRLPHGQAGRPVRIPHRADERQPESISTGSGGRGSGRGALSRHCGSARRPRGWKRLCGLPGTSFFPGVAGGEGGIHHVFSAC